MVELNEYQRELCTQSTWDFSDLKALFINCTLKKSPELSHTQGLIDISTAIMDLNGVATETIRAVDFDIAPGVWPDMTEHGFEIDAWPALLEKVAEADILVLGSSIWLGEKTSVCT
ncbi:MAG: flavodoxin family protein, partial [Acidimicrobiia bacterium]|nr:flavodoxin family protein [Acidimicrobiia bacterium]